MNRKRTQRLSRSEGLRRPAPCKRKRRPDNGGQLFRAERPNHVWALDFQFDETADHRRLKLLNIVDEHTREALAMRVGRSCNADQVVAVIEALVATCGAPGHLRIDNGPELVAWALRDWGRLAGTTTTYIEPGSPWENPFIESFNGRVRDELLLAQVGDEERSRGTATETFFTLASPLGDTTARPWSLPHPTPFDAGLRANAAGSSPGQGTHSMGNGGADVIRSPPPG